MVFLAVVVLLCCFLLTSGLPTDLKCLGKQKNEQIHYELSSNITEQIQDCEAQWLVKEKVVALYDGIIRFEPPIVNATATTAIMENDSEVQYTLDCPNINVHKRLSCSYSAPLYLTTLDPLSGNGLSMKEGGFPDWGIAVGVVAGGLLATVFILVCKIMRKKPGSEYVPAGGEIHL